MSSLIDLTAGGNDIHTLPLLNNCESLASLDLENNEIVDITPLSALDNLTSLHLSDNNISDLSPLSGLVNIDSLHLYHNEISDLSPLVMNQGIGDGDRIPIYFNPIDCIEQADNIQTIKERGAILSTDCD